MTTSGIDRARLLLSVQRALLGAVSAPVSAVAVRAEGKTITLTIESERRLDEREREELEVAASEIAAAHPEATSVTASFLAPGVAIGEAGWLVFLRYRPER